MLYTLPVIFLLTHGIAAHAGAPEGKGVSENGSFTGIVVQIVDGDSLIIRVNRENRRIALYGIDCPENNQVYGNAAQYWVNMLVFHKEVRVRAIPPENFRQTPALIYFGEDRCLNQELVLAGLAWVDRRSCQRPECRRWIDGEESARRAGVGLWKDREPMPPWKWREMQASN
jgi:endonuclease YncB( thermonuclease family)